MPRHGDGREDAAYRTTVSYIDRSRIYYADQGFQVPYRWAKHDSTAFSPLQRPLSQANVAVITTAKLADAARGASDVAKQRSPDAPKGAVGEIQSAFKPFAAPADPAPELSTDDLAWHKKATHTDDLGSYLPVTALQNLAQEHVIGRVNDRIFGVPTVYSHRRTLSFADSVLTWCREDDVDVALLVPI